VQKLFFHIFILNIILDLFEYICMWIFVTDKCCIL